MDVHVNVQQMPPPLMVAPVQWSRLEHIDRMRPLDESDLPCLAEVREVLRKYGNLERFGIALLHTHFVMGPDEIMLEETDVDSRTQVLKPVKQSEVGRNDMGTIWMLQDSDIQTMTACVRRCRQNILNEHNGSQKHTQK